MVELEEIVDIIKAGKPAWVDSAINEHKKLCVHINGRGTAEYLDTIDNIENANQLSLRKKFLTTNRHAFANLSRPIDKVFSAKGGGNIYNLNTESKEKTLRKQLSNIRHGKSIRTWIKDIQSNKYYTDPSGLVFFEWGDGRTYPTIKSIKSIQNYKSEGRTVDWVLFNPIEEETNGKKTGVKLYRFVDDSFDYLIRQNNESFTIEQEQTFVNPFKTVPAIINSDIINSELTHSESPFEVVISLADHYLRTGTIKNLVEFLHGYPIFWRYLTDCKECHGTGYVEGQKCASCGGSGKNLNKDITDIINIEPPSEGEVKLAPDLAGYVTPDIDSWAEMRKEQESIMSLMELTMWGSKMVKDANNETATAAFLNVQPVNDRLNGFSDAYEDMEKKMTDLIGIFYLKEYGGSSISYGRRYLVETPDVIWGKYEKARTSGVSKIALNYLLLQFFQSEYSNDLESLVVAQKSMKLEPFIHKTDEEIFKLPVSSEDKTAKFYFNEWFKNLSTIDIISKDDAKLQEEFNKYLESKTVLTNNTEDDTHV